MHSESSYLKIRLIAVFALFCILPMAAIGVYSHSLIKRQILATASANLEAIAKIKAAQIESFYKNIGSDLSNATESEATIELVAKERAGKSGSKEDQIKRVLQSQLEKFIEKKGINEIHVLTTEAKPVVSSFGDAFEYGSSYLQSAFYQGKNKLYFSDVYESIYANKRFAFAVGQPIKNSKGETLGVAVAEIGADSYFAIIGDYAGLGKSGESFLVQNIGDKTLFLNPLKYDEKAALVRSVDINSKIATDAIAASKGGTGFGVCEDYRGKEVLAAWRYIPSVGFGIVSKIDLDEVLAPLWAAKAAMLGAALFISLFGAIFSIVATRKILKPISSLEQRAKRDPLTGLLNRSSLDEALKFAIESAKRNGCMAAVLAIDLDGFKNINDTKGHEAGDIFLKKTSIALSGSARFGDFVIRLGGDEFLIVMEGVKNLENVKLAANSILFALRSLSLREFGDLSVSASIGVAVFPLHEHSEKALLKMADEALYEAKRSGKNSYKFAKA